MIENYNIAKSHFYKIKLLNLLTHGYINMGWKITDFDTHGVGIDAWPMSTSQWLHSLQRFAKQLRCLCDVSPTPS